MTDWTGDDRTMSTHRSPSPRSSPRLGDPVRFATRRLSSLVVVGGLAAGALVSALLVWVDVSAEAAVLVGVSLFLIAVALATMLPPSTGDVSSGGSTSHGPANGASRADDRLHDRVRMP
jgi:type IV secretory pathway TrbD component